MANSLFLVSGSVVATGRAAAQTAAVASVVTYTVGALDATFLVSANVLVTTATNFSITTTIAYTDAGGTGRTITVTFWTTAGGTTKSTLGNADGAIPYHGFPYLLRCKAATSITVATAGTFSTIVYDVDGIIQQVA